MLLKEKNTTLNFSDMKDNINWDLYRYFEAVAEAGSLTGAAHLLGSSPATVGRHIEALERATGCQLFDKAPGGYTLTRRGEELKPFIREMSASAAAANRRIEASKAEGFGRLRIGAGNWVTRILLYRCRILTEGLDGLTLEWSNRYVIESLAQRDVDLAIRNVRPKRGRLVIRSLGDLAYAVYGAKSYVGEAPVITGPKGLRPFDWIGYDESGAHLPTARWRAKHVGTEPALKCTMATNILDAIVGGAGIGILPVAIGDEDERLVRLYGGVRLENNNSWLVYHQDLRRVPIIRILSDRISKIFAGLPRAG